MIFLVIIFPKNKKKGKKNAYFWLSNSIGLAIKKFLEQKKNSFKVQKYKKKVKMKLYIIKGIFVIF